MCVPADLMNYVTNFQWDKAKYPTALPLSTLVNIIDKVRVKSNGLKVAKIQKSCVKKSGSHFGSISRKSAQGHPEVKWSISCNFYYKI